MSDETSRLSFEDLVDPLRKEKDELNGCQYVIELGSQKDERAYPN